MATFKAYYQVDSLALDLNFYSRFFHDDVFLDNAYESFGGKTYQDIYLVNGWDGSQDLLLGVGGTGLVFNQQGDLIGGTVTGLAEAVYDGGDILLLQGFSVSAARLYNAGLTYGNADDRAVLSLMMAGNDTIQLSAYDDRFEGWAGHDRMSGQGGNDTLIGGAGNDTLIGGAGDDTANGGPGHDRLAGGDGHDRLLGAAGNDILEGGRGGDRLEGGLGRDRMSGGVDAVRDVFVFRAPGETALGAQRDSILQFRAGQDDIHLSVIDANPARAGNQGFAFTGTAAAAYSVWYVRQADGVLVRGDVNGNKAADFEIWVDDATALGAGDFIL